MSFPVPHRIRPARANDAGELLTLQRAAFVSEAQRYNDALLPPLRDTVHDVQAVIDQPNRLVLVAATTENGEWGHRGRLVGAVRLTFDGVVTRLGRVVVAPDLQGRGIGSDLLEAVHEEAVAREMERIELIAGAASSDSLALYRRFGYRESGTDRDDRGVRLAVLSRPV